METKKLTHRLYINEYNEEFVKQLSWNKIDGLFCTDESTDKVLAIVGTAEALRKLAGLMFADENEIKAAFPSFVTKDDAEADCIKVINECYDILRDNIARILCKYEHTGALTSMKPEIWKAFDELVNFYVGNRNNKIGK